MGFCLFESAHERSRYFAVNPQYVEDVEQKIDSDQGLAVCFFKFLIKVKPFIPLAVGQKDQIRDLMMQALNVPLNKVDLEILSGQNNRSKMPLLLNNANRIVLVYELFPDDIGGDEAISAIASRMVFEDGTSRIIVQRPALFVQMVNAGGQVPQIF